MSGGDDIGEGGGNVLAVWVMAIILISGDNVGGFGEGGGCSCGCVVAFGTAVEVLSLSLLLLVMVIGDGNR